MTTPDGIAVRSAGLADLDEVALLFEGYRAFYEQPADAGGARAFLGARLRQGDSKVFVAETDGRLVGFTQAYPLFSSTRMKPLWLLNDLFVHPDHRGKGISKLLIERVKELARSTGACGVTLETDATNTVANRLYLREDFTLGQTNWYNWAP